MHIPAIFSLIISEGKSNSYNNFSETEYNASSGQLANQSNVEQSTKEGNYLHLIRKLSPTGDIHNIICK